jgi:predicted SAM-dependent methyltransferase
MNLNVGSHDIRIEGFENLDIDPLMNPDKIIDCTKLTDYYSENSIDFLYCGHFLEHFQINISKKIVQDFYYILKNYGTCCCVIPDFQKVPENLEQAEDIILASGLHLSIFNEQRLIKIFREVGFTTFKIDVKDIPWTPFPNVSWQSAVLAVKHLPVEFK